MGHVATGLPLQRVAIDIMGPLPQSTRGNRFIMVVSDYFTKWTEAYPLPNQIAGTSAGELAVGATVYYYHPLKKQGLTPKLQSYWTGPWKVHRRIGQAVYEIKMGRASRMAHYDALKEAPPDLGSRGEEGEARQDAAGSGEYTEASDIRRVRRVTAPMERGEEKDLQPEREGKEGPYTQEVVQWLRERRGDKKLHAAGLTKRKSRTAPSLWRQIESAIIAAKIRRETGAGGAGDTGPAPGIDTLSPALSPRADRAAPTAIRRETTTSDRIGRWERGPARISGWRGGIRTFLLIMVVLNRCSWWCSIEARKTRKRGVGQRGNRHRPSTTTRGEERQWEKRRGIIPRRSGVSPRRGCSPPEQQPRNQALPGGGGRRSVKETYTEG